MSKKVVIDNHNLVSHGKIGTVQYEWRENSVDYSCVKLNNGVYIRKIRSSNLSSPDYLIRPGNKVRVKDPSLKTFDRVGIVKFIWMSDDIAEVLLYPTSPFSNAQSINIKISKLEIKELVDSDSGEGSDTSNVFKLYNLTNPLKNLLEEREIDELYGYDYDVDELASYMVNSLYNLPKFKNGVNDG